MMGFWVVALGLAAIWVLLVMPVLGLICLALSLVFRYLHKRYLRRLQDAAVRKWRRVLSIIFGVLAGINLVIGAAGWIFILAAGA